MSYLPIENYGIIGDMQSVALIGLNGSIDWWCYPRFDSPSVFGAILDHQRGGRFQIAPPDDARCKQFYFPDTNVLVTRFLSGDGVAELTDFMPIEPPTERHGEHNLVRKVTMVRGSMPLRLDCRPAFNYARVPHQTAIGPDGAFFRSEKLHLGLATTVPLQAVEGGVAGQFVLKEGETASFIMAELDPAETCLSCLTREDTEQTFRDTVHFWRRWLNQSTYRGRWREMVNRSALVLKLLTYQPTGAIVAAPTCSLPEFVGGVRNWDYRYTWIRDASFSLYALMRIGFTQEAHQFIGWLNARIREPNPDGSLQVMYSIEGLHDLTEETLDHLTGYCDSRPVRVGNGAHNQLQLDIYGELMDSIYLYNKYGTPIDYGLWNYIRKMIGYVCDHWHLPDQGIWEVRSGQQQFVYSKLMCWVALDRALRLADKRSFPADRGRWLHHRDAIYEEIMSKGWNRQRQAFVQFYGSEVLDASALIMPLVFFVSPTDPRMRSTLDAILRELVSDSLVYRYNIDKSPDGLCGEEGTFSMCTFWLVEALARARRTEEARLIFEKMLGHANHLGLFAEEVGPHGEALGNFPQGFTHLALISAAYNLDKILGEGERSWEID